ncbi:hypothetical protein [Agrobacterium tumefaciens]|uniref:hypothetical protein n=1 Tax=Agrobacterium tumefaciens TaxID=358 RepID=UPI003B9DE6A8
MPRVRFTQNFNYEITPAVTRAYKAGWTGVVKRDCADKATKDGKAVLVTRKGTVSDGENKISG